MDDDEHLVLVDEKVIIEEEEEMQEEEVGTERRTIRHSNDDDVLQVGVEDEELELKEVEDNTPALMDDASLEDGEVEEEKKKQKTLRSHLPDILQGIDEEDEIAGADTEHLEKLRHRAEKFGCSEVELISPEEANKILSSLNIPLEERERKFGGKYCLNYVEMYGVFSLSDEDLEQYFGQIGLKFVQLEEISDDAVFVKFASQIAAFKALGKLSKPIGERRREQKIIKHVLTADGSSPERKVITQDNSEDYDNTVNPEDIGIVMPEGTWRYGKQHKKCQAILMRFPLKSAFRKTHHLQNDGYRPAQRNFEPPPEAVEIELEERENNKNFDKKNPWGSLSERWAGVNKNNPERMEYVMPMDNLVHPPVRLATGRRDWDNPSEPDHPVQIRENRKRKYDEDRVETYFEAEEVLSDSESGEEKGVNWSSKLKRPRMGMVADLEEAKNKKGVKGRIHSLEETTIKPKKQSISNLKRRISNNYIVEEKFVIESDDSEDDLNDSGLVREAQNADLRHQLTMRVDNTTARPILKPTRKLGARFGGAAERSESEGEDKNYTFENMKIQIRQSSSEDERMEVDNEPTDIRHKIKQKREAREQIEARKQPTESVDLRNRMSRHRQNSSPDNRPRQRQTERASPAPDDLRKRMTGKTRVKNEFEEEKRKEEQKRARTKASSKEGLEEDIEEKIHELESVKEQEKALLDKLNNKLKRMEKDKQELKTRHRDTRDQSRVSRDKTRREHTAPSTREKTRREPAAASSRGEKVSRRDQVSTSRDVDRRRRSRERRDLTDKSRGPVDKSRGRGRHDSTSRKKKPSHKRSAGSSSSDDSSSSDSDDSSSSSDSDNSSSDESSSSSSSSDSSSSSSDSDSSSDESSPDRKKKSKSGKTSKPSSGKQEKNRKSNAAGGSSSRPASGKSTNKKSTKNDDKSSKSEDKRSGKTNPPEDKKKDADLKAKLENFVTKTKSKKDKK